MAALKVTSKEFERRYREKAKELLDIAGGLSDRPTPDEIHDLRVTGRRFQVMRRLLPRRVRTSQASRRFDLLLKSALKRTSQLRDLDTLMSTLSEHRGSLPNGLLVTLGNQRSDAAAGAKAACDVLSESPPPGVDPSEVKGKRLSRRLRKRARKSGRGAAELLAEVLADESKVDELHALRVDVKKLRYLLELSERSPPELTVVTRWQESLGAIHDLDVAIRFLRGSDVELKGWAVEELQRSRHRGYLKFVSEARADSIEALESGSLLLRTSASQAA